jgi:hypothetical protein
MTSRGHFGFQIHVFDSFIRVEGADAEICDALDRYIFPPVPHSGLTPSSPDIHLSVERNAGSFCVLLDDKLAASANTLHDAVLEAVKTLDDLVVHRMKLFRAVHAGAVLIEGRALLFPGSTHAGKSSLVAELLHCGASYFSDEYALIDNKGRMHSYPRPLLLRNGRPAQSLVLPEELNASFAAKSAPIGWILALDYVPGAVWKIQAMSQGEAVMLLLRNTPHQLEKSPEMIDCFLHAAANAVCYEGQRGEASEAATHVMELAGHKKQERRPD